MRIFVYIHYLEIGGAERALIGLLNTLDRNGIEIDLFLNQHTGEFMSLVPGHVRLLPQLPEYSAIERPIKDIVREGHIGIALRRIKARLEHRRDIRRNPAPEGRIDESVFQYVMCNVAGGLRSLDYLGEYDLAISFLHPHNIVLSKVKAKRKLCWIHTDYSTVYVNHDLEAPIWGGFDAIAAISDEAGRAFAREFPEVADRIVTIENILSPSFIRQQADMESVDAEMPKMDGCVNILSIGRYCEAKRFDQVPRICRRLIDRGLRFRWYIVGFGDDTVIRENIAKYGVGEHLTLLGKKSNPYPYIKACDIYAQPSRYEGKSVTVREAQILCRPAVISNYPTASSQVVDGVDGVIAPLDIDGYADALYDFAKDKAKQLAISAYLSTHDYGNETEADKIVKMG